MNEEKVFKLILFLLSALVFTIEFIVFIVIGKLNPYSAFGLALAVTFLFARKGFEYRKRSS